MYITGRWEPTRRKGGSMGSPMQGVPTKGETFEMTWPRCSIFINLEKLPPDWTVQILSNNLSHLLNLHDSQINSWTNTVDYVIYSETNITHHLTEAFKPNKTCTSIPTYLSETERNENSNTHRTSHRTSKKARTMRKNPTHALGGNFPIRSFSSPPLPPQRPSRPPGPELRRRCSGQRHDDEDDDDGNARGGWWLAMIGIAEL